MNDSDLEAARACHRKTSGCESSPCFVCDPVIEAFATLLAETRERERERCAGIALAKQSDARDRIMDAEGRDPRVNAGFDFYDGEFGAASDIWSAIRSASVPASTTDVDEFQRSNAIDPPTFDEAEREATAPGESAAPLPMLMTDDEWRDFCEGANIAAAAESGASGGENDAASDHGATSFAGSLDEPGSATTAQAATPPPAPTHPSLPPPRPIVHHEPRVSVNRRKQARDTIASLRAELERTRQERDEARRRPMSEPKPVQAATPPPSTASAPTGEPLIAINEDDFCGVGTAAPYDPQQPKIYDRCPSCGARSLFIGAGGWLTCSVIGCKEPGVSMAWNYQLAATRRERDEARRDATFGAPAFQAEVAALHSGIAEADNRIRAELDRGVSGPDEDTGPAARLHDVATKLRALLSGGASEGVTE